MPVPEQALARLGPQPGQVERVRFVHRRYGPAILRHPVPDRRAELGAAAGQRGAEERALAVAAVARLDHPLPEFLDRVRSQLVDVLLRHRLDQRHAGGQVVARDGVDQPVVGGQVQAVRLGLAQHRRTPDDAAGVVVAEHGQQDGVVGALVGEAAEDPGRDADHVAVVADVLALLAVGTPAQPEGAAEVDEDLGGEVQMQAVADAARHPGGADVIAVPLGQIHHLVGVLRDPRTDVGVVGLLVRPGRPAVDEGGGARHPVGLTDGPASQFLARYGHLGHDGDSFLGWPDGRWPSPMISRCWRRPAGRLRAAWPVAHAGRCRRKP